MKKHFAFSVLVLALIGSMSFPATAQEKATVLAGAELSRLVPSEFYFQGLSGQTQMRNTAAARFGTDRYVISGLVDTSGYAAEVRSKYEGFLICDTQISVNGQALSIGAYGFGFANDGTMTILDVGGNQVLSVKSSKDTALTRPRPLMMSADTQGVRLYSGRDYVVIRVK
ncbi:MAG TPA: hypothetical protein VGQ41_08280 [Pyrinomonadaceae bacterium]|jgi:hypothetical protein|nr:hypothetical protein [Pyrinomonadaceae bacterium]